ncbi:hypothetical protein AGMMS49944_01640 [Spirochaetia bacterium]|nr:hypothetical protein AGMMS49944_01640 [Spirochaetia bacterium]
MRWFILLARIAWLILPVFPAFSQEADFSPGDAPYLIPQTIFVGDKGRLVVPLGFGTGWNAGVKDAGLPRSTDLVINRVELERRGNSFRLLVDFQAFTPGRIVLPPIEIAFKENGAFRENGASHTFTGLEITVSSILQVEQRGMVLSEPAEPLAAPGTAALIYGTILGIILLLLALALGGVKGRTRLRNFAERLRRRRVIRAMAKSLKRLRAGEGEILETLSGEFRTGLGILTGTNCRAMVPREFLTLPALGEEDALSPAALSALFRRCDTLRFSGADIEQAAVVKLLDDFKEMTVLLEAAEKDRYRKPRSGLGGAS